MIDHAVVVRWAQKHEIEVHFYQVEDVQEHPSEPEGA